MSIVKDFETRAMESGSDDPKVAFTLSKCDEYVPGKVDAEGNNISCGIQHNKEWRKVIKDRSEKSMPIMYMIHSFIFRYPDAIIGKPAKHQISEEVVGISFLVRFQ